MMGTQRRGQSTIEYAVVASVVVGALLWMQIYMKRGVMGKMQTATDQIGEQFTPLSYTAKYHQHYGGAEDNTPVTRTEQTFASGETSSKLSSDEVTRRGGDAGNFEKIDQSLVDEGLFTKKE